MRIDFVTNLSQLRMPGTASRKRKSLTGKDKDEDEIRTSHCAGTEIGSH